LTQVDAPRSQHIGAFQFVSADASGKNFHAQLVTIDRHSEILLSQLIRGASVKPHEPSMYSRNSKPTSYWCHHLQYSLRHCFFSLARTPAQQQSIR